MTAGLLRGQGTVDAFEQEIPFADTVVCEYCGPVIDRRAIRIGNRGATHVEMGELMQHNAAHSTERRSMSAGVTAAAVVHGVTKNYGKNEVLRGVFLEVRRGEIFGLLGSNGAGKTTLVEIMEGLRELSNGEVRVLGLDPQADGAELRQRIGVVLQDTRLHDKIRISEAMRLFSSTYRSPAPWEPILRRFELWERRNDAYQNLSGGLKQRLAIALALINNPELIFMDEPTVGLDPQARRDLQQLILRLRSENRTVILTTHYVDEAEKLCDRIALLDGGKVFTCGTPTELRRQAERESMVRIAFSHPVVLPWSGLKHEEERQAVQSDDRLSLSLVSSNPWRTLGRISLAAHLSGAEIVDLEVTRPSLEDSVLFLIARRTHEDLSNISLCPLGSGASEPHACGVQLSSARAVLPGSCRRYGAKRRSNSGKSSNGAGGRRDW